MENHASLSLIKLYSDWAGFSIDIPTFITNTQLHNIPQTLTQVENPATQGWKELKLKLRLGLDSAGQFYQQLVSKVGEAVGVADGEPYWNGYLGQWLFFGLTFRAVVRLWYVIG